MKLSHRIRTVAATALLTVAGCSGALAVAGPSFAASNATKAPRAVQCRINFQASSLNLRIGQDLVLSWTAVGADKLTASWTSGYVPFVGAVTTTMSKSGTFSYQVTGSANGVYCGGAGVQVKFTGAAASSSSSAPAPAPSTSRAGANASSTAAGGASSSAGDGGSNGGGSNNGGSNNGGSNNGGSGNGGSGNGDTGSVTTGAASNGAGGASATTSTGANGYPIQSPTSGTGVPWYQDPINLLAVSALALMGSLLLWRREQLRAVFFVRKH